MRFCSDHQKDFDAAHASLPVSSSNDATSNPPTAQPAARAISNPLREARPPTIDGAIKAAPFPAEAERRHFGNIQNNPGQICAACPLFLDSHVYSCATPAVVFSVLGVLPQQAAFQITPYGRIGG